MKYQRFIPLIIPLLIWLLAESFLVQPGFFYPVLALGVLLLMLSVRSIGHRAKKYWLFFTVSPVLFLLSFLAYAAISVNHFWIQVIYLLIVWFIFLYLRDFYYYTAQGEAESAWTSKLDNLLISGGFLTAFAAAAALFDLSSFITWPLTAMLPVWALIVWLLFIQFRPLRAEANWPLGGLALIGVLVLTELAGVFSLFPLNFNILALLLAIIYYFGLMIIRLAVSGGLNRRALKLSLILSLIAILFLFLTARWL